MKKSFFQRLFDSSFSKNDQNKSRRLVLESLENRTMLSATSWEGFNDAVINSYQSSSSSEFSFDLLRSVDLCQLAKVNNDNMPDLIAWNKEAQTIDVYQNNNNSFTLLQSTTFSLASNHYGVQLSDVTGDGLVDFVVAYQPTTNQSILTVEVYPGQISGTFVTSGSSVKTSSLNLTSFPNITDASVFFATDIDFQINSGTRALTVHVDGLLTSGSTPSYYTGTALFSNDGSGSFNASGTPITSSTFPSGVITKSLSCVADINLYSSGSLQSTQWIVENNTSTKELVFYKTDGSTTSFTAPTFAYSAATEINGISLNSINLEWSISPMQNVLVSGGTLSDGTKGILVSTLTILNQTVLSDNEWITLSELSIINKPAAFADLNGDETPEIFITDSQGILPLVGSAKTVSFSITGSSVPVSSCSFTPASRIVSTPNYHSSTIVDLDNDGLTDVLAVGNQSIWFLKGKGNGEYEKAVAVSADFAVSTNKAVFGDFNGDGKVEVAIMMGTSSSSIGGTAIQIYELNSSTFQFVSRYTITLSETNNIIPAPQSMVVGHFSQTAKDELAILGQGTGNYQCVQVFSPYDSFAVPVIKYDLGTMGATSIVAGKLFDSLYDDIITTNTNQATLTILQNTKQKSFSSQSISVKTESLTIAESQPVSVAIGDINNDTKADIVFLNKKSSSVAYIGYFLQDSTEGFSNVAATVKTSSSYVITGTTPVTISLNYYNADSMLDLIVAQSASEKTTLYAYLGTGESSYYFGTRQTVASQVGVQLTVSSGLAAGKINTDSSNDIALVGGKVVAALVNRSASGGVTGKVQFLCQSASQTVQNYADSVENSRTWLDEWSNFYMEIWATTETNESISSFSCSLNYNSGYFLVDTDSVVAGNGFSITSIDTSVNGVVTLSGTSSETHSANEMILLGRLYFIPNINGGINVEEMVESGQAFAAFDPGFSASTTSLQLNNINIKTVLYPDSNVLPLYPVQFDADDDGEVTIDDYSVFARFLFESISNRPQATIFDTDNDGEITIDDYSEFVKMYISDIYAGSQADAMNAKDPSHFLPVSANNLSAGSNQTENLSISFDENDSFPISNFASNESNPLLAESEKFVAEKALQTVFDHFEEVATDSSLTELQQSDLDSVIDDLSKTASATFFDDSDESSTSWIFEIIGQQENEADSEANEDLLLTVQL
ncbi:MAG: FG-GAP-like repeat-containing protein [Planctomycetia bacterium]|nr:FG-GAP-like repeat-containing protein [Planctomycetia bacterium]